MKYSLSPFHGPLAVIAPDVCARLSGNVNGILSEDRRELHYQTADKR